MPIQKRRRQAVLPDRSVVRAIKVLETTAFPEEHGIWSFKLAKGFGRWPTEEIRERAARMLEPVDISLPSDSTGDTRRLLKSVSNGGGSSQYVIAICVLLAQPKRFFTRSFRKPMEKATETKEARTVDVDIEGEKHSGVVIYEAYGPSVFSDAAEMARRFLDFPEMRAYLAGKNDAFLSLPEMLDDFAFWLRQASIFEKANSRNHTSRSILTYMLGVHVKRHTDEYHWNELADLIGLFGDAQKPGTLKKSFERARQELQPPPA